jgi:CDP-diacylglycerol--glycerol-3-phosphate 3-phosphatidyltransferase
VNLPNALTIGRIFLVPLLVVVLLTKFDQGVVFGISSEVLGATIFAVASFTDWLDGFLARRRGQVTGFGQWMDPLADKLLVTAALVSLVQLGLAPAWMVAVILGREFSVTVLRSVVHARGQSLPASPMGKVKMVTEIVAILLLLGPKSVPYLPILGRTALWLATIAALVSGVEYWRRFNGSLTVTNPEASPATRPEPRPGSDRLSA